MRSPALLCVLCVVSAFSAASAQEKETVGAGIRSRSMGGTGVAGSSGHDALYYNPAALTNIPAVMAAVDLGMIVPSVNVSSSNGGFDSDAEGDLDTLGAIHLGASGPVLFGKCADCRTSNAEFEHPCPTCSKPFRSAEADHWLRPVFWGVALDLPLKYAGAVAVTSDQNNGEWVQYGRSFERLGMTTGFAYRVSPKFSAGLSLSLGSVVSGSIVNDFAALSSTPSNVTFEQEVDYFFSVNLGVLWAATESIKLGLTYRSEQATNVENESTTDVTALGVPTTADVDIELTPYFAPQQLAVGVEWKASPRWTLALDMTWSAWSDSPGPYSLLTVVSGPVTAPPHPDVDFKDTLVFRLGAEHMISDTWTVRGGYSFHPSPVPEQDGATNIIDSDAHVFTFGAAYRAGEGFTVEGCLQWHLLTGQDTTKADSSANPPSWDMDGSILVLGIGVRWPL